MKIVKKEVVVCSINVVNVRKNDVVSVSVRDNLTRIIWNIIETKMGLRNPIWQYSSFRWWSDR